MAKKKLLIDFHKILKHYESESPCILVYNNIFKLLSFIYLFIFIYFKMLSSKMVLMKCNVMW